MLQIVDRSDAPPIEFLARIRERQLAGGALHQARAKLILKSLDPSAYRVGRHDEPSACLREAAGANDLDEKGNVVEIDHLGLITLNFGQVQSNLSV